MAFHKTYEVLLYLEKTYKESAQDFGSKFGLEPRVFCDDVEEWFVHRWDSGKEHYTKMLQEVPSYVLVHKDEEKE